MRILIINAKKVLSFVTVLFAIIFVFLFASVFSPQVIQVFTSSSGNIPIYSVDTPEKKVSITFDCAWGADDIGNILSTLKKENVKASFFLVGEWMKKYPEQVKAIAANGHDIANHSDTHPHMTQLSAEQIKEEIRGANARIEQLAGRKCDLFRAPYGDYNEKVVRNAGEENQYIIQWDVDSLDWKDLPPENICDRIMRKVKNGSIILLHNDTKYTASALPAVIKGLKNKGYAIVPVSQLIYKDKFYIDFEGRQHVRKE